jgi:DNA-directed RNA polymerase subunit RPC12/RpoP
MSKDINLVTVYCNKCGKAFESDPIVNKCIYCGSECIVKVKIHGEAE